MKMQGNIKIISCVGQKVAEFIPQIADLRIEIFAEYPFLYIGDYEYEQRYLNKKFLKRKEAIIVLCFDQGSLVGLSTGYPFIDETEPLQQVLRAQGRNPSDYFCFGESVLRKSYRGLGIGKEFFVQREAHVRQLNHFKYICFYTIIRPLDDPRRPPDYRPLGPFWESQGFVEHPELVGEISYQEIGEQKETPKKMVFWIKKL